MQLPVQSLSNNNTGHTDITMNLHGEQLASKAYRKQCECTRTKALSKRDYTKTYFKATDSPTDGLILESAVTLRPPLSANQDTSINQKEILHALTQCIWFKLVFPLFIRGWIRFTIMVYRVHSPLATHLIFWVFALSEDPFFLQTKYNPNILFVHVNVIHTAV